MSEIVFSSLNPYQSLEVLEAEDPQGLIDTLKAIKTPVKIVQILTKGNRFYAFVMGDVRKRELKRFNKTTKEK